MVSMSTTVPHSPHLAGSSLVTQETVQPLASSAGPNLACMDLAMPTCPALELLVEWLREDIRAGLEWDGAQFGQYIVAAVKATDSPRSWVRAIVECAPAWRDAYEDQPGGISSFGRGLLDDDDGGDPRFDDLAEVMTSF